jgi:ArsR family metal-binding transcriptional regulator
VRVSPGFFNTLGEIDYFIEAIQEIAKKAAVQVELEDPKSGSDEYVTGYRIQQTSLCFSDAKRIRVVASFPRDIEELFPYLNAVLRGSYNREGKSFTFSYDGRPVVLEPKQMTLGKTEDLDKAREIFDAVIKILNKVYADRDKIVPTIKAQIQLSPLSLYKNLPRTNCRKCGELTCLAFAAKVIQGESDLKNCPLLQEPDYAQNKEVIEQQLAAYFEELLPRGEEFPL